MEITESKNKNIQWIDYAKGIGIILVVIGHVVRGLINAELLSDTPLVEFCDRWIYSFHMPLFFIISGMLLSSSLKKSFFTVLKIKAGSILYPYFLWATFQTTIQILLSSYTNTPKTFLDIPKLLYQPVMQFWFLYVLFMTFWPMYLLNRFHVSAKYILIICLTIFGLPYFVSLGSWGILYQVVNYLPYVALGATINSVMNKWLSNLGVLNLIILSLGAFVIVSVYASHTSWSNHWISLLAGTIGTFGVILLSEFLTRRKINSFLKRVGQLSLEIFLVHTLASAAVRIILQKVFHIEFVAVHIVAGVLFGILGPLCLIYLTHKVRFKYAFSIKVSRN